MKIPHAGLLSAGLGALFAAGACSSMNTPRPDTPAMAAERRDLSQIMLGEWSEDSALAARLIIDEYGVPDEVHYERFLWNDKGPWRRTMVRNVRPIFTPDDDRALVEQTVGYALTPPQAAAVATALGGRVSYDARKEELTARSDREGLNYLTLNLAHDVVVGALSPEQARASYANTTLLEESGKTLPYLLGLRFTPR